MKLQPVEQSSKQLASSLNLTDHILVAFNKLSNLTSNDNGAEAGLVYNKIIPTFLNFPQSNTKELLG